MFNECQLVRRLESIKHYFFLDRGDFFLHFIEGADDFLDQPTSEMPLEKLESFLEMAIRTSSANSDPFKDDVTCELNAYGLIEQLFAIRSIKGALGSNAFGLASKGDQFSIDFKPTVKTLKVLESFTLDYKVKWPLTLILSRKAITKYQLIFRHLFSCKYVERLLDGVWLTLQQTKEFNVNNVL